MRPKTKSRRPSTRALAGLAATAILVAAGTFLTVGVPTAVGAGRNPTAYQILLRQLVDSASGAPRSGRDPAAQQQTSLAAVAARPNGTGRRAAKPASGATAHNHATVEPSAVLPDPMQGMLSSGCATGYGQPGAQCLPAHGPNNTAVTCGFVRQIFPTGVAVTGPDQLRLDRNNDKVACGDGD